MKTNILSWLVPFLLGTILSGFAIGGFAITEPETIERQSLTPVMDRLNEYACRKAETKQIILGGQEDGFSPKGNENTQITELNEFYRNRTGGNGNMSIDRNYDMGGYDQIFLDRFMLPENTAHGVFVARLKQLGSLNNDNISIGELLEKDTQSHLSFFRYSNPMSATGLKMDAEVLFGTLGGIEFPDRYDKTDKKLEKEYNTLLEYIRKSKKPTDISISDDTMVDVIGFAICTEPDLGFGTTFIVEPYKQDYVSVGCNSSTRKNHCQRFSGDTICSKALPMACFSDTQTPLPAALKSDLNSFHRAWSGGTVKFTEPIRGDQFQNQEEVHTYCESTFGESFRAANIHDGLQSNKFIAEGTAEDVTQVWVDSNLEPYGNCWSMKADYHEVLTVE